MTALHSKLFRDLVQLKGQALTIALVVACGVASFVLMQSTWASLQRSKDAYYERFRFGDVFGSLKRAPNALAQRLEEVPGVARVQTRIVRPVMLPLETLAEPATGKLVSLPNTGIPVLNDVYLRQGRLPERDLEVLVLETFALANGLEPGDPLPAVLNGTLRDLQITGLALSPEYVFAMAPGDITSDEKRFAVLWMREQVMAPAYQMEGAFDDVSIELQPGTSEAAVLEAVDRLLEPYGGLGSVGRARQTSNFMLNGELEQLRVLATVLPMIFLGVAAFLLNVVLSRLVGLQRQQIATLKAVGYSDREVGLHYLELVSLIVLVGSALGVGFGAWGGQHVTAFYGTFFKFPTLAYRLDAGLLVTGVTISLGAALAGGLLTARRVAALPPAQAMRPPTPDKYRPTWPERLKLLGWLGMSGRMVVREIGRQPLRTLVSAIGISMAVAVMVVARFWHDAMDSLVQVQFHRAMREDVAVGLIEPRSERAVRELAHLPGVLHAEGLRSVPVRIRSGSRYRDIAIQGYPASPELRHVLDKQGEEVPVPERGVMLTTKLAEILRVGAGDSVQVEVREGDRRKLWLPVTRLVDESFGLQGHMRNAALEAALGQVGVTSMVLLRIDTAAYQQVHERLKQLPQVASVTRRDNIWQRFEEQSGEMMAFFTLVATAFAVIIAVGVVYNNARVALSVRSRDLASLRVLGFTRAEISSILLGELGLQVLLAVPIGLVIGTWMAEAMMASVDPETYRFAVVISAQTYAFAAAVTLASGLFSALLVRRQLDKLDLVGVLKTRE